MDPAPCSAETVQSGKVIKMGKNNIEELGGTILGGGDSAPGVSGQTAAPLMVLAIDDDLGMLKFYESIIGDEGARVEISPDPIKGVDLVETLNPDLIILDLTMPVMSGESTLNHLRRINPAVPVVLSSGFNEAEATRRFNGDELAGFLQKPYTALALAERVKVVLNGKKNGSV